MTFSVSRRRKLLPFLMRSKKNKSSWNELGMMVMILGLPSMRTTMLTPLTISATVVTLWRKNRISE